MPFISVVCNLVQIAEVVRRDALVDKAKEFFAALNAAMGIGRDDAPWQWAMNSDNARLARLAQAAIGNWSAEEKITNDKARGVCNTNGDTRACAAVAAFNEYNTQRVMAKELAQTAIAPDDTTQGAAWSTTGEKKSRHTGQSEKLCLGATAVYLCTGPSGDNPCRVNGANPENGAITTGNQSTTSGVKELWGKLSPVVCHAPTAERTFHNGEDEEAIALFRSKLQDRRGGGGGKHTLGKCDNFDENSERGCIGYASDVASGKT
ncbi:hypothetical protein ERJ75_001384800 [Trypanosoma vivax]|nr:hypothetical protein ERJ75_001384800 [Trypanosoma vivax]